MAGVDQDYHRPLSMRAFKRDLDRFEQYIAEITMQDSDASVDEKRAKINETLRYEPFCEKIKLCFGQDIKADDIKAIFRKISTNPEVKIEWSEVFGYFQNENEEGDASGEEISVFTVSKRKKIGEAAGDKKRRDVIQCITHSPESDIYVTASQKGALSVYNGKLRLQSCIDVNEPAWMTSCEYLPKLRKIIATTERTVVVWDYRAKASNQSSLYVIKPLEHSPQCMCLLPTKDDHSDSVLIGDDAGYVNLFKLTPNDFASNNNKDPKKTFLSQVIDPSTLVVPVARRKFHPDWVLKVEYLPDIRSFASCSPSDKTSFVISELKRLHDTQPVSELSIARGVNAFAYSEKANIFATGGVDKIIRVWHPNILSRPTGKMVGHLFTIIAVVINDKDQHIISLSTARVFRVWDIHTLSCLQVFTDTEQKSGEKRISCLLFDGRHDRLFTGSSSMEMWPMTRTVQDIMAVPHTHDHPLSLVVKNGPMSQILTACSESIIKVWEVDTGRQMYQILEAHGLGIEVTAACVDSTGTFMITGAYDGSMKIWEFSSGQELKSLPSDSSNEDEKAISWIACINRGDLSGSKEESKEEEGAIDDEKGSTPNRKRRILAFGWNNKLMEFEESDQDEEIKLDREFDDFYEWPSSLHETTETTYELDPTRDSSSDSKKKRMTAAYAEDETVSRKEHLLLRHEITCCSLVDESPPGTPKLLLTGCSNGNVILWDHELGAVQNLFELEKAELPSRYESREKHMKDMYPHRVNVVGDLSHKIFRPDPEELRRRQRMRRKKLQEIEEDSGQQENDDTKLASPEADEGYGDDDDPAEEIEFEVETSSGETDDEEIDVKSFDERQLLEFDKNPIKMVRIDFPKIIVSCHQDCNVRLWSMKGDLVLTLTPMTKVASPITAMCHDEDARNLIVADSKGYVTLWDVSEFLERPATTPTAANADLTRQILCWRAHLMKIVALSYVDESGCLITASTDGSVRVWYPHRAHYIGYFGQHRVWSLSLNPSLPSSPVLPYDINEGPMKTPNVKAGRRKSQPKKYDYPLIFDATRWKPFRRSAYDREVTGRKAALTEKIQTNFLEVRNKKFFRALVKPKGDKSNLESSKPAEPESGAIFRALPVYRLETPPPHPRAPSMDVITGGSSWDENSKSTKSQTKSGAPAKPFKGRTYVKKPLANTPVINASKKRK